MTSVVTPSQEIHWPLTQPKFNGQAPRSRNWVSESGHSRTHTQTPATRYTVAHYAVEARVTIQRGAKLGSGGFAHVFKAVQSDTKRVVALKQSRASLHLKRPALQHEARVLKLLSGHPSIPEIYAYGRIEHFEVISMQLLHRSLGDVVKVDGPLGVKMAADFAYQMTDALQHVHSHMLVHRDIKPDNIMLRREGTWKFCLIDFGLARYVPSTLISAALATDEEPSSMPDRQAQVFGTLPFASLSAHEKDCQLTFRDDLESLAYSIIWLLRGRLPWSDYTKCGTRVGRTRQVFAQKKRHTGSTLATKLNIPVEFGELVDYARSLSLYEKPDYQEWQRRFKQIEEPTKTSDGLVLEHLDPQKSIGLPEPPIEVGQIVLIKLNSPITAEGYSMQEGHESSFIPDPYFDGEEWSTVYRPGVIVQVEWDERLRKYSFLAIAISRRLDSDETPARAIPISIAGPHTSDTSAAVQIDSRWPLNDSYFYVFKRPVKFYCLPSQEQVHATWRVTASDCDALRSEFSPPAESLSEPQERADMRSPDPDIRHDARLRRWGGYYCPHFAQVRPLTSAHFDNSSINWFSKRAWFDECVKAQRHRNLHGGAWWTGAWFPSVYHPKEGEIQDSYSEPDYSMWRRQLERRTSITLAVGNEGDGDLLEGLAKIVSLEQESEVGETRTG